MKRLLAFLLLVAHLCAAQAAVHLSPIGNGFNFLGQSLRQLSGGLLYTYQTGTSTPAATYTDSSGATPNSNPIVLTTDGRVPSAVWLTEGTAYRFQIKDSLGNVIQTIDGVYGINDLASSSSPIPTTAVNFLQSGVGAVSRTMQDKNRENVSVKDFNAKGDGSTDDAAAFTAAITAVSGNGGDVIVPYSANAYRVNSTLTLPGGVRLIGQGSQQRWYSSIRPVRIDFRGSGSAITVAPGAAVAIQGGAVINMQVDGTNSAAGTNGLYLNASAAGSSINGFMTDGAAFTNFPNYQVYHNGTVYDITHIRLAAHNSGVAANDVVRIENGVPSQIKFIDPFILPYTTAKWGINASVSDALVVIGGTVAPQDSAGAGANGISANGGLVLLGSSIEGVAGKTGTVGILYKGSTAAIIQPAALFQFGANVKIGDGTAAQARGWFIAGGVSQFNAGGKGDVWITNGGSRTGMVGTLGFAGGTPTITDERLSIDGVNELIQTGNAVIAGPKLSADIVRAGAGSAAINGVGIGADNTGLRNQAGQLITVIGGTDEIFVGTSVMSFKAGHDLQPRTMTIQNDVGAKLVNQTSGAAAAVGTLNNAPNAGDPVFWLKVQINGVTRYIPAW